MARLTQYEDQALFEFRNEDPREEFVESLEAEYAQNNIKPPIVSELERLGMEDAEEMVTFARNRAYRYSLGGTQNSSDYDDALSTAICVIGLIALGPNGRGAHDGDGFDWGDDWKSRGRSQRIEELPSIQGAVMAILGDIGPKSPTAHKKVKVKDALKRLAESHSYRVGRYAGRHMGLQFRHSHRAEYDGDGIATFYFEPDFLERIVSGDEADVLAGGVQRCVNADPFEETDELDILYDWAGPAGLTVLELECFTAYVVHGGAYGSKSSGARSLGIERRRFSRTVDSAKMKLATWHMAKRMTPRDL